MAIQSPQSPSDDRAEGFATHEVMNQPGALEDYNAFAGDEPLIEAVRVFGADWAADHLKKAGALVGSANVQFLARQANRHLPELRTHDRFGHRVDVVEFHPAYHELMALIYGCGAHSFAWTHERPGAHVARAALSYLWNQGENGICCPMGMTFASIPALRHDAALLAEWAPLINRSAYDTRPVYAKDKSGVTVGMAMTEKQGGSDLRATMTTARAGHEPTRLRRALPAHRPQMVLLGADERLVPHARADRQGLVLLPRHRLAARTAAAIGSSCSGSRTSAGTSRMRAARWSSTTSTPSCSATKAAASAPSSRWRMLTRLDFAIGSSGLMRQALSQAIHHTSNRRAFQRSLDRSADHAQRGRRLRRRERGDDVDDHAPRPGAGSLFEATARRRCCHASAHRSPSTGRASARRSSSPKRSNVMAATASSPTT